MGAKTGLYAVKQVGKRKDSNNGTQPFQQDRVYDTDGISPALQSGLPEGAHKIIIKGEYDGELDDRTLESKKDISENREVLGMQYREENRDSSQGRKLAQQLNRKSSGGMPRMSHKNSSEKTEMQSGKLRPNPSQERLLRETQPEIQEVGKPVGIQRESALSGCRIRRLTPIETERLQGYKDGWTATGINEKGIEVPVSDSQRYKCCGNSVTTFVVASVMEKLYGGK